MKKAKLLLAALAFAASALSASAQNVNVSGVVSDSETGEPVMGAVVQLQGSTTKYSMTDMGGGYTLDSVPADGTMVVSILGYESAEIKINGRTRVDIILAPDVEMLTDAIVLGYGSAKKISSITGSATTVGAKLLQNAPFSDMTRISMLAKLNTQITDWLKTGFSLNLAYQDVNTTGFSGTPNSLYNPMYMASQMYPWMSPYEYTVNPDGSLTFGNRREYFDEMAMYNTVYLQRLSSPMSRPARSSFAT